MKLNRLQIRRLAGLRGPLSVDFAHGLNLVVGPNGAGKSSLARALKALLWPDSLPGQGGDVEGRFLDRGAQVRARRSGRMVRWERDGAEAGPPSLPGVDCAPCYAFGASDLLGPGGPSEAAIAREVRLRMAGGYDLERILREQMPLDARHGHGEKVALEEARREHAAVQNEFRELARREEELEGLLVKQEIARNAQEIQPALQTAVQLAETRRDLEAVESALKGYPEGMERLHGNELERLAELEAEADKIRLSCEEWEARVRTAQRRAEGMDLPNGTIPEAEFEAAGTRARRLRELEGEIRSKVEAKRQAQAALAHAWKDLGGSAEAEEMQLDLPSLAKLDAFLARSEVLRHTRSSLESSVEFTTESPDPENVQAMRNGADALREWLSASKEQAWWQRRWAVACLGGIGALAGALAMSQLPEGIALAGPLGGALVLAMVPTGLSALSKDAGWYARRRFEQSRQKPPEKWVRNAVRERLRKLDERLAKAELEKAQDDRRRILRRQLKELKAEEAEHEKEREQLKETLGVDPGSSALGLVDLARRIQAWRGARAVLEGAENSLKAKRADRDALLEEINKFLGQQGYPQAADAEEAETRFEKLRERSRAFRTACEEQAEAERQRERVGQRVAVIDARKAEIFAAAGVAEGNQEELVRRIQRLPEYRNWRQRESRLRGEVRALASRLTDHPELRDLSLEQAQRREAEAQEQAAKLAGVSIEAGKIQERLAQARRGRRLENAVSSLKAAREALGRKRDEALFATAGRFLLQSVEQEYKDDCMPDMLRRAAEWASAFTGHGYALRFVDGEKPGFRVIEASTGKDLAFDELSGGTRAQVLLALRLAYATHAESGTELPLFLDEALAGADAARFRIVAETILGLVEAGRQVIYLSSRESEAARWRAICADLGQPEPRTIALGEVEEIAPAVLRETAALRTPGVPAPKRLSVRQYAEKIQAGPPDPFGPVENLHLIHLLPDDLPTLHRLLEAGVKKVGPLRNLLRTSGAESLLEPDQAERLLARADLADEFFRAWREGRRRAVDRRALESSRVVGEEYLDRIASIAEEVEGDAIRLLAALDGDRHDEIQGFFGRQLDALRAFLEEGGYLDRRGVLTAASLKVRVLEGLGEHLRAGRLEPKDAAVLVKHFCAFLQEEPAGGRERGGASSKPAVGRTA